MARIINELMDRELRNFGLKIRTIPRWLALDWITVAGFKLLLHVIKSRFLIKSKKAFRFSTVQFAIEPIVINQIRFLKSHNQLPSKYLTPKTISLPTDWQEPFLDEQDLHLLHRLRELPWFVIDKNNSTEAPSLLNDWIINNPAGTLPGWHPYTLSERLVSLCWSLHVMSQDVAPSEFNQRLKTSIIEQANFLRNNFEFQLGHHNHLINNARALLTAATLLTDLQEAAEWRKYALDVFKTEWPFQILSDGVHTEQSVTYHFLLTRTLWEMKYLMSQMGERFPYEDDLDKMIYYARVITRPDGTIPFIGHLTPDWHWKDLAGLLSVWGIDDVPVSDLGKLYNRQSDSIRPQAEHKQHVLVFPSAGQGILRTEKIHAVLCCDPRGEVKVHGDQNLLGLDLWHSGTHLIRDAGLASYNIDEKRSWYESWQGQSTFSIDNMDPIVSNWRKRQLPEGYYKVATAFQCDEDARTLKASHTGYARLPDPVYAQRQIHLNGESDLYIEDDLQCKRQHLYSAKFHFGHNTVKQVSDRSIHIKDLIKGNSFELQWSVDLELAIEENPFATAYGEESMGNTASFKYTFTGNNKIEYLLKPV